MEDVSSKIFIVGKFLNYRMVDSKIVIKLQVIFHDIQNGNMSFRESF